MARQVFVVEEDNLILNVAEMVDGFDVSAITAVTKPMGATELTVVPTTEAQEIYPEADKSFVKVNVEPVTADIDTNIKPTNIREGVQILGVTGTVIEADPLTDVYYAQQQDLLKSISGTRVYNENDYNESAMQRLRALLTNMTGGGVK